MVDPVLICGLPERQSQSNQAIIPLGQQATASMQQSRLKSGGETITRLLEELCRPGALERVREGERTLKEYVEAEARDLSAEMFAKLMADLHSRIQYMMKR